MVDTNTTADQGAVGTSAVKANGEAAPAKLYPTRDAALAAKPADAPKSLKPMEVSKNGTVVGWVLARGYDHALATVARTEGFTVSTGAKTAPVTVEAAAAKLASLSDAELAVLGLTRKPVKAGGKK